VAVLERGRVLTGIQVHHSEMAAFQEFLGKLGYTYCEESANSAYRLFLAEGRAGFGLRSRGAEYKTGAGIRPQASEAGLPQG
jgi:hypothetical protein